MMRSMEHLDKTFTTESATRSPREYDSADRACLSSQVFSPELSIQLLHAHKFAPGFFSHVPGSLLKQVGRGYTDLAAALLAAGLGATELQIWKEVDGIFTADPRKVPTARLIPVISPEEAAELTYYGSEVVHPFTMEQACIVNPYAIRTSIF